MGVLRSETACKGWIYHADILLQPILSLSLSVSLCLPLSLSCTAVVHSFALLGFFYDCFTKWQNTNMPFSLVCSLRKPQMFLWEITTSTQTYCSRAPTVDKHCLYCALHKAEHANERSDPSTSISTSNSRDTGQIQLYVQLTLMQVKKNSHRCINQKSMRES